MGRPAFICKAYQGDPVGAVDSEPWVDFQGNKLATAALSDDPELFFPTAQIE